MGTALDRILNQRRACSNVGRIPVGLGTKIRMAAPVSAADPVDARLLAIAAEQLRLHGARGVTVVRVAEAAGMTHANVYRYFPSKAALIDAVADRWLKGLEATLAEIADSPDPADDKLERLIQAIAHGNRELLAKDRHLFDVYADAVETSRAIIRKHRARQRQLIDRVVDEGIATGKFDPRDRDRAVAFVGDAAYRFINPLSVRLDADMPLELAETRLGTVIRVILRALASGTV
jgi:AcrR family transcriptional regulator